MLGVGGPLFDQDHGEAGRDEGHGEYDTDRDHHINSTLVSEKKHLQVYSSDLMNMSISKRYCESKSPTIQSFPKKEYMHCNTNISLMIGSLISLTVIAHSAVFWSVP